MTVSESLRSDRLPNPEDTNKPRFSFGLYLPKHVLTNEEIASWDLRKTPDSSPLPARAILSVTGVEKRYAANEKETPLSMGLNAAQQALNGKKPDVVIVSTSFPQGFNFSQKISEEMGLTPDSHLDVHAACSGFTRSLSYLKENEQEFNGKRILLVATEKYSPFLHDLKKEGRNSDPSLAQTLFSDGAFAIYFELENDLQILSSVNHRFPKEVSKCIQMPVEQKLMVPPFINESIPYPDSGKFEQNGSEVVTQVRNNICQLVEKTMQDANLKPSDIQMVFPHQGSRPTTETVEKALDGYLVYKDYREGNFSSGSIPKALMKAVNQGEIKRGDNLVLAGFGAGMFASIAIVRLG